MQYRVIKDHNPESAEVLSVLQGEVLRFERRKTIYPGWIWCTDSQGIQAWVPEDFVTIEGSHCRLNRDYNSRELPLEIGDTVEIVEIVAAWALGIKRDGQKGWVPIECLELHEPEEDSG